MNVKCDCKEFIEWWPQLRDAQFIASEHGLKYTGPKARFCPWCGKELKKEED